MKEKILIFGISGFVGPYLAEEFLSHGYEVFGTDIQNSEFLPQQVYFEKVDLLNFEEVNNLITKIHPDIIVNLAAISSVSLSWKIPQKVMEVNVIGSLNILEASRKMKKIPKILFIGSSEEYTSSNKPMNEMATINSSNPYGISKTTLENFINLYRKNYDMKIYYVRPFNHTGVGQKDTFVLPSFCKQMVEIENSKHPGVIKVGNLEAIRDFSHVKDIVRGYRLILESEYSDIVFNIGSGKAYSLNVLLNYIIAKCNQEIKIEVDPERFRPVEEKYICCDHTLLSKKLNWNPEYSVFDAIDEIVEFYRRNRKWRG